MPAGAWAILEVSDTGDGISDEARRHMFEPFFTTKADGHGTGLGLTTVRSIVEQAGGHVRVASARGEGATFRIYLPLAGRLEHETVRPSAAGLGNESVWVVEDDPQVRSLAVRALERRGFRARGFASGESVLAQRPLPPLPAVLVTDVVLPGMDGATLARRLREREPTLAVLFVTGYGRGALPELPSAPVLAKPFSSGDLASAVRAAIDAQIPVATADDLAAAANG